MKTYVRNMTEGSSLRPIIRFSVPILAGNLFQQLYNVVDSVIVGRYVGTDGLAAVGATGSIQFLFFSVCFGLASGIGIIISQFFGAGESSSVKRSITNGALVMLIAAIAMSIISFLLAEPGLHLMGTPDNIIDSSVLYLRTVCTGLVAMAAYNCIAEMLRALGDSKTPLMFLVVSTAINIVLDLFFILTFHMGVFGAALATVIAQAFSAAGAILFAVLKNPYFQIRKEEWKIETGIVYKCIKTGLPVALQYSMIAISCIALQAVVNAFGSVVVAAYTVTSKVENVISQPYATLTSALAAYSGQNIGAGKVRRVQTGFQNCSIIMAAYTLCVVPAVFFGGTAIMQLFVQDAEVTIFGANALKITSLFYLPLGMIYVTRGVLNGTGDTMFAFLSGAMEMLGRICLAKPLTRIGKIGVWGIWFATSLTWLIAGLTGIVRYGMGKWALKSKEYEQCSKNRLESSLDSENSE